MLFAPNFYGGGISVTPSDPALCVVTFVVWGDEAPLQGAIVRAKLLEPYSITSEWQAGRYMSAATTNSGGVATLQLIRSGEFEVGGTYMIEIYDPDGVKISSYKARVPNEATINASELIRG